MCGGSRGALPRGRLRRRWVHSLGPVPLGESLEFSTVVVDRNGHLLAALRDRRRPLAAARDREGRRSALPRSADRLRGQALLRPQRRRSARGRPRGAPARRRTAASCRAARPSPCRSRACSSRAPTAPSAPSCARRCARSSSNAGSPRTRSSRSISPRALWRQPRRRARGLARLFRQGAATALARRSRVAGRDPAVARGAPSRPFGGSRAARARPRARSRRAGGPHSGRRDRAGQDRDRAGGAPADADVRAACRRSGDRQHRRAAR